MKIIKEGTLPEPPVAWWVGREFTCSNCKQVVVFEAIDLVDGTVTVVSDRSLHGDSTVWYVCQKCDYELTFKRSDYERKLKRELKEEPDIFCHRCNSTEPESCIC